MLTAAGPCGGGEFFKLVFEFVFGVVAFWATNSFVCLVVSDLVDAFILRDKEFY